MILNKGKGCMQTLSEMMVIIKRIILFCFVLLFCTYKLPLKAECESSRSLFFVL
ncbi:unnamed protein product [Tenebrio molitor]|nr:unnamed protein product [Tenebrio molitor]